MASLGPAKQPHSSQEPDLRTAVPSGPAACRPFGQTTQTAQTCCAGRRLQHCRGGGGAGRVRFSLGQSFYSASTDRLHTPAHASPPAGVTTSTNQPQHPSQLEGCPRPPAAHERGAWPCPRPAAPAWPCASRPASRPCCARLWPLRGAAPVQWGHWRHPRGSRG